MYKVEFDSPKWTIMFILQNMTFNFVYTKLSDW